MSDFLKFPLFKGVELHPDAVKLLGELLKPQTFQPRDVIIDETGKDPRMFFLLKGQVTIQKTDEKGETVVLGKADGAANPCFGESILLGKFSKSASVVAQSQCQCLSLSAEDFQAFMQRYPFVVANVYRTLASQLFDRLSKANKDLFIQGVMNRGA
jgi:CRP-like cAMP-binding protein